MNNSLRFAFGAAAIAIASVSHAQLPDPGTGDAARQQRMDDAYRDHKDAQARPARFSEAAKRDAHEAGHAIGHGARATGHAIADGTKATGHAIHRGVKATGHAIHQGVKATGHAIHEGVDKVTGKND